MSLNTLPAELQQVVYDFDGRYKSTMARCFLIITQRRSTFIGESMYTLSGSEIDKCPQYYAEILLRAETYQSKIKNGKIPGITSEPFPIQMVFSDVMGIYVLGTVNDIKMIDGKAYRSFSSKFGVSLCFFGIPKSRINMRVGVIDVLDPEFRKSVKNVKEWRDLGVSENGVPIDQYIRSLFGAVSMVEVEVDGREYTLVDNRHLCRGPFVYGHRDGDEVVWLTRVR